MIDLRDSHISLMVFVDESSSTISTLIHSTEQQQSPAFYGKSSENPYYLPLFDFIVGKALDLRKATFFMIFRSLKNKKTALTLR